MTTVLVTDHAWPSIDIERAILAAAGADVVVARTGEPAELAQLAAGADAILTCWRAVTPAVLAASPGCRVVARYGVGVDNIAVDAATDLGIVVTNVQEYCVDEVAEHALALILALTRQVVPLALLTREGRWDPNAAGTPRRLHGQTLGIVGFGSIGRAVAARAHALGMRIVAHGPRLKPEHCRALSFEVAVAATLEELLATADVVSLHTPLTKATHGLIGAAELAAMKPSALLVNTSRGGLVDTGALAEALAEGSLRGAGLDVLPQEPPDQNDPLLGLNNVIVTPHAAFLSEESVTELQRRAAGCVASVLRGELPPSVVNPEVLDGRPLRMQAPTDAAR